MKKRSIIFFIFIPLIFSSLNAQESCKIKGAVIDKDTGKPLEGVYIYLNESSELKTLTDKNGRYELSGLSPGKYKLNAFFPGYKKYSLHYVNLSKDETKNLTILLEKLDSKKEGITEIAEPAAGLYTN